MNENEPADETHFEMNEWFLTKTQRLTEAKDNSEMAYFTHAFVSVGQS